MTGTVPAGSSASHEDRQARLDVRFLREMAAQIKNKTSLHELFETFLLTLMGRFQFLRAAIYLPAAEPSRFRMFLSKGAVPTGGLPDLIRIEDLPDETPLLKLVDLPVLDPGGVFSRAQFSCARVIAWTPEPGRPLRRQGILLLGSPRPVRFTAAGKLFLELICGQVTQVLAGSLGGILERIQDLERRSDLVRDRGQQSAPQRRRGISREDILHSQNLQTLQDIAFRFKGGVSLQELFSTYLLTLMGRLRLKRAAIYASTMPASRFIRLLVKGRSGRRDLPETVTIDEIPGNLVWGSLRDYPALNPGNVFGREGLSLVWVLSRDAPPEDAPSDLHPDAMVFMGADGDIQLTPANVKFIEILNQQIVGILKLLDSVASGHAAPGRESRAGLLDWDSNLSVLVREGVDDLGFLQEAGIRHRIFYRPAHKVGGDFYDVFPLDGGRIAVVLADVVGHGISAAMWTQAIRDHLRHMVASDAGPAASEPAAVLRALNGVLAGHEKSEIPVSVCYGIMDPARSTFTYASAGIHFPMLFRARADAVIELPAGGLFLGCLPDIQFSQETLHIERGDLLVLYTDGLHHLTTDAWRTEARESIGRNAADPEKILDEVLKLTALSGEEPESPADDRTALLFLADFPGVPDGFRRRLVMPADVRHLPALRSFIASLLGACGNISRDEAFAISFTSEDVVLNAIQHGYKGRAQGVIAFEARMARDHLEFEVSDLGRGFEFDPGRIPKFVDDTDLYRPNGRGLYMMFQLMDEVKVDSKPGLGTTVRMVKYFKGAR
ncbi:MAG: hypothetical protein A3G34_11495 [Candidatus Lindowbacteria bacterium RIFCSPLOWO2_12_FULL_62_27]|nr:MAG: hypothetical protein A3G34_11495 [Candidatus Lindowbacteria bacterium RIFCSPLOWO2_12_FULL_62_27]